MPVARVAAQAKVNLLLRVGPRRDDGFHDVLTMLQMVDLADDVVVRLGGAGRTLHVAGSRIPETGLGPTEKNLAYRAALAYADRAKWPDGFSIELIKNIPAGGGLGGGSSDAGAVLRALNAMNERPLGESALLEIAATLGSDVPFFVAGSPCAIGVGRGEEVHPWDVQRARDMLLIVPPFAVATADAYRWLDEDRAAEGPGVPPKPTRADPTASDFLTAIPAGMDEWDFVRFASHNDFETVVERRHPALKAARDRLVADGAALARMSGSGSTIFGVFDGIPPLPTLEPGWQLIRTRMSSRVVPVETRE